ncbi:MAG TPA: HAMP domain-containing sensor histidine kinase [Thermomicrobiales bacterium]|nr:HAMP domain-containing sensor histidine kinase [Thermomicrobiales bacterium]
MIDRSRVSPSGRDASSSPAARLWSWVIWPWRLFQQRTSIQMIASYIVAFMLAIVLLQATIVGSLSWGPAARFFGIDNVTIDPYFGERARSYSQWIGVDDLVDLTSGAASPATQLKISASLDQITAGTIPGFDLSGSVGASVADAAVIAPGGSIVATSDPAWMPVGSTIASFPSKTLQDIAARSLALGGGIDPKTENLYSLTSSDGQTFAATPIIAADGSYRGSLLIEGAPLSDQFGADRLEFLQMVSWEYAKQLWIFSIPALLVAIPFGVWRSRSISRRLDRLAGAADALAQGNLKTRVVISRHDEIGRLAERFNEMGQQIEDTDRARRAFISNVSHDLRTPVSIIHGTAERMVAMDERGEGVDADSLSVIQQETTTLTRLIDDLFTLARIEEHSLRLERDSFQIAGVVKEAVDGLRDLAWTQQKVTVESLVSRDLPLVFADRTRIRQVINNLLYNALRHTPEGGLIVVQAVAVNEYVEVSITDTGRGIPANVLPNLFTRYWQAERSKRRSGGSGLGLTIVKQLVEAHQGEITVESQVGQGTTFRFTIPQR